MAYWWVSQGKTFRQERVGNYLWAPQKGKNDTTFFHWSNMRLVQPGDIIFSYLDKTISAVAIARSGGYEAPRPSEIIHPWHLDGIRVDADYTPVPVPLLVPVFVDQLRNLLPDHHSPLTRNGTGVQGYLFSLPTRAGRLIADMLSPMLDVVMIQEDATKNTSLDDTTRKAIVDARIGQGVWRKGLLHRWSSQCAASGLDVPELLKASHIKPWRDSNNHERLDIGNGLLLNASYDAAFDAGLISFSPEGNILVAPMMTLDRLRASGIECEACLRAVDSEHLPYLQHHRDWVFSPIKPLPPLSAAIAQSAAIFTSLG